MGWDVIRKEDAAFYESSANIALRLADVYRAFWGAVAGIFAAGGGVPDCLAPLLFLSVPQAAPLAWLCPVLFVLLVLPMRQNAAQALASLLDGAEYPLGQVVSFQDYGRKLLCSLRQGLCLVVWGLPCLAVTVGMSMAYNGLVDAFTLMRFFMDLGGGKFTQGLLVGFGVYALSLIHI